MVQTALAFRPLSREELEERVADAALEILVARGGQWIRKRDLADACFRQLSLLHAYSAETRERRTKAAVRILRVERRKLVSSSSRGYALATAERPDIRRQVAEIRTRGETIRAVDPALADALTPFLDLAARLEEGSAP